MEEKDRSKEEIQKLKDELAVQTWGLSKTNAAIKFLYKELEKKNKELREIDNLKSDFINAVSHELRTPLNVIREVISQILEGMLGETTQQQKKFLSICLENVDRLKRMIENLLDVAKLEAGKVEITREEIDIADIAKGVMAVFCQKFIGTDLELKEKFSKEKIIAYADSDSIIQVFTNLIGNAFKFTDKGCIEVCINDNPGHIECSVSDTGRGISEKDLPKVFNKFQQFGKKGGSEDKGTGLGLSICKGIIELHHGKIWVESKLNEGARFIFTLPKYTENELYRERITEKLKKAIKQKTFFSILSFTVKGFDVIINQIGAEKISLIMHDLEDLIKQNLRSQLDIVFKTNKAIFTLLPDIEKQKALEILKRLHGIVKDYLAKEHVDIIIESLAVGYPEDGDTEEQLYIKITGTI